MTSYQPGIPTGTVNLDTDYKNIQNNFGQLDTTYGSDHVAFSQAPNNGYHKVIRLVPNALPAAIPGIGQFFDNILNDGINTDTISFFLSGGNKLTQMTRNFTPTNLQNGATSIPGGMILNWGIYNAPGGNFSSGSTTNSSAGQSSLALIQPFPVALYIVGGNLLYTTSNLPSAAGTLNVRKSQLSAGPISTLSWQVTAGTNNYIGFVWWALGI
jgi:hypothetical protein